MQRLIAVSCLFFGLAFASSAEVIPIATKGFAPDYPAVARQAHISGTVVLEFKIVAGKPAKKMEVVFGKELQPLVEAAKEAAAQWEFPAEFSGKTGRIQFIFMLQHPAYKIRVADEEKEVDLNHNIAIIRSTLRVLTPEHTNP